MEFLLLLSGGCFSPHVRFVQTFSVVGTGRAGVTGKWIGIPKEVANNKRLIHVGTRRRTRMMDADQNWSYKYVSYAKKECNSECVVISILTFFISVHGQQFLLSVLLSVFMHFRTNYIFYLTPEFGHHS